jgi:rubrerythrin
MATNKDIETMIQALTMTIAIHEREEAFFRRSAGFSTGEETKELFLEIAKEMNQHAATLQSRKTKLVDKLAALVKSNNHNTNQNHSKPRNGNNFHSVK